MFTLLSDAIDLVVALFIFAAGIRFNQKWPNAGPYLTWVFTAAESMFSWIWTTFSNMTGIGKHPSPAA